MREVAQMWVSGLITDKEITDHFAKVATVFRTASHLLPGLIDPNTGLRYTNDRNSRHGAQVSDQA